MDDIRTAVDRLGRGEFNDLSFDLHDESTPPSGAPFADNRVCGLIVSGEGDRLSAAFVQHDDEGDWDQAR